MNEKLSCGCTEYCVGHKGVSSVTPTTTCIGGQAYAARRKGMEMSSSDLIPPIARCLQNFRDVERHDPREHYIPPTLEDVDSRAKQNYLNNGLFKLKVDTIVHAVYEQYEALIKQARAEELEANIKAIEESQPPETTPQACVAAIRARSGK